MQNKTKGKISHAGHRQRLKSKVKEHGLKVLSDHEIVELLLTYTIPYKDTNPLGHYLLDVYGSIDKIVDADFSDLTKINGVGNETALFLNILSQFADIYKDRKGKVTRLKSSFDGINYFRTHYQVKSNEYFYIFCLNKQGDIVKVHVIPGKNDGEIHIDLKDFSKYIMADNTSNVMLFHTHPLGNVNPSEEDVKTTQKMLDICTTLGVGLLDHIIVNEHHHFSMGSNGVLDPLRNNTARKFNLDLSNILRKWKY